jgi:hypothetical protein
MKIPLKIILFITEFEEILYDPHIHYHWDYNFHINSVTIGSVLQELFFFLQTRIIFVTRRIVGY